MTSKIYNIRIKEYNGEQEYITDNYQIADDMERAEKIAQDIVEGWYEEAVLNVLTGLYENWNTGISWRLDSITENPAIMVSSADGLKWGKIVLI